MNAEQRLTALPAHAASNRDGLCEQLAGRICSTRAPRAPSASFAERECARQLVIDLRHRGQRAVPVAPLDLNGGDFGERLAAHRIVPDAERELRRALDIAFVRESRDDIAERQRAERGCAMLRAVASASSIAPAAACAMTIARSARP